MKYIKSLGIDVYSKTERNNLENRYYEYKKYLKYKPYNDFVSKWCPASLRRKDGGELLYDHLKKYNRKLNGISTHNLRKGSKARTFEDWLKLVYHPEMKIDLKEVKDLILHKETDEYIIYEPLTFQAYIDSSVSNYWCFIYENYWNNYKKVGMTNCVVCMNKKEMIKSYIYVIYNDVKVEKTMYNDVNVFRILAKGSYIETVYDTLYINRFNLNEIKEKGYERY